MSDPWATPPILTGTGVVLRPLERGDAAALVEAAREGELWTSRFTVVPGPGTAEAYVDGLLAQREAGTALGFAVIERATGTVIGTTRYLHIDRSNRNLEIGGTFIARRVQGTRVNPEMKLLMLTQAFETMGCLRVSLQTDERNSIRRPPSPNSAPSAKASCAATASCQTASSAIRSATASSTPNGQP